MKLKLIIICLIILFTFFIIGEFWIYNQKTVEFYAYGDSIISAYDAGNLAQDGSDAFVLQMVNTSLPGKIAIHSMDGSGKTSLWGWENIETHYNKNARIFVYMFTNDPSEMSINQTIEYYILIHNYVNKNSTVGIPIIPILTNRPYAAYNLSNQKIRIKELESALEKQNIYYIKMYDALDSVPNNGVPDEINTTYLSDNVHPNKEGQRIMGQYLWSKLKNKYIYGFFVG